VALSILVQYYRVYATPIQLSDIAKGPGFTSSALSNFLARLSPQDETAIFAYFRRVFANDKAYDSAPTYIKHAITAAFNFQPEAPSIGGAIANIINRLAIRDPEKVEAFNASIVGVYDVLRYSAHIDEDLKNAPRDPDPEEKKDRRAYVVRAALQVFPVERTEQYPRFVIHYRPKPRQGYNSFNTVVGTVVLIEGGKHMLFLGEDRKTNYPLFMMVNYDPEGLDGFNGLVVRLHETGRIFASRVCFGATTSTLIELDELIGLFPEHAPEIADLIEQRREMMINYVAKSGRSGLHMHY
jgi:hypothetical protein